MYVPKQLFFTKGVGTHREKLSSFELALRDARIACYNLVRVSSIFPPKCLFFSATQMGSGLADIPLVHHRPAFSGGAHPARRKRA